MCTDYYIKRLKDQKRWYIDTCAIVNHKKLSKLVENKEKMIENGIKLYVINPVYQELNRLLYKTDESLARDAKIGLNIIQYNSDLFEIEGLNERMDIDHAFADPDFYQMFSKSMITSQLYITDDKKSAHDVNNHNFTWSFSNKQIYICSIDENGELVKSDGIDDSAPEPKVVYVDRIIEKEVSKTVPKSQSSNTDGIKNYLFGIGTGVGLSTLFFTVLYPYGKRMILNA